MKQFTLNLDGKKRRPVIQVEGMSMLLDTGAELPIWTAGKQVLLNNLDVEFVKSDVFFSGFGGKVKGDIYKIKGFKLGELTYAGLDVIVCEEYKNATFYMIVSATMFQNLIYQIDDKNHKLNVDIPVGESDVKNLVIKDYKGIAYVLCNGVPKDRVLETE